MTITLPAEQDSFLSRLVAAGRFASPQEAVTEAVQLHGQRRAVVEKFLHAIGLPPAQSTSRNPLEPPWTLAPEEFTRRAPCPDPKKFTPVRDETAAFTAHIQTIEHETDQRVTALHCLPPSEIKIVEEVTQK